MGGLGAESVLAGLSVDGAVVSSGAGEVSWGSVCSVKNSDFIPKVTGRFWSRLTGK